MKRRVGLPVLLCLLGFTVGALPWQGAAAVAGKDPTARAASTSLSATQFENRLFARINTRRANHGCRQLRLSSALVLAARRHSTLMAARHELSHRLADEADLGARVTNAGYTHWRILAENLAWGQSTPRAVFRAWISSPGHRANLDNCRLRDLGVGVMISNGRPWVTADLGRRRA